MTSEASRSFSTHQDKGKYKLLYSLEFFFEKLGDNNHTSF
jgi:hypothetical protein